MYDALIALMGVANSLVLAYLSIGSHKSAKERVRRQKREQPVAERRGARPYTGPRGP